jgi:predicted CoA-binding protein
LSTPNPPAARPTYRKPTLRQLRPILVSSKTIAVVGLSDNPVRPSHSVAAYLQQQGYRIIPVNPNISATLGEKAYASVRDIPGPVDMVQIFRRPEAVPAIVEDAIAKGARVVWMQVGVINKEAAARARSAGLTVVMDTCMRVTHQLLRARGEI